MKSGIDFFPLDVSPDCKLELIEAEFGLTGFGVVVHLLQEIYGKEGYYIEWTEEVALLFSRKYGVGGNVVSEIVSASIRRGMFDSDIFDKYHILTSRGIQKRYFEAVSRRKVINVRNDILLVDISQICKNANIERKNVNISKENVSKTKQSKVKESRAEDNIDNNNNTSSASDGKTNVVKNKDVTRVIEAWNSLGMSQVKKILPDTDRGKMLRKRIQDYGIDDVLAAVEEVRNSSFLTGHNDRGWMATFDWFIAPNNFAKVLSGNYDNKEALKAEEPKKTQPSKRMSSKDIPLVIPGIGEGHYD